ncbi:Prefoldin subunit 3 [Microtus ochrogaster]|uniref:Prefoldin subunit 3 n=1 Tax=Microtus ochrogaster TaxID=79684 RepID=A0A8J6GT38_MICOH|nr:Prefoldin subunit 3 [Microtus ochrogaster]
MAVQVVQAVQAVHLESDAFLVCLNHALSTEKEEVMGLCIGEVSRSDSKFTYTGTEMRTVAEKMAAAKDGCGLEAAAGNGRRLHLGIPEAVFVEDVDSFMKQPGNETADTVLKKLDEQYQKYKFMELNLAQKKRRLKGQIPEIKQTLEILKYMQKKKESTNSMETRFLLADNLYCKASVPPTDKVCLWLGANVMLEYDIDEAQALLEKNLSTATKNLDSLEEDLDFLRDQFTTTEVSLGAPKPAEDLAQAYSEERFPDSHWDLQKFLIPAYSISCPRPMGTPTEVLT